MRQAGWGGKGKNQPDDTTKQAFCGLRNSQYFCCTCLSLSGEKLHGMDCKLSNGLL